MSCPCRVVSPACWDESLGLESSKPHVIWGHMQTMVTYSHIARASAQTRHLISRSATVAAGPPQAVPALHGQRPVAADVKRARERGRRAHATAPSLRALRVDCIVESIRLGSVAWFGTQASSVLPIESPAYHHGVPRAQVSPAAVLSAASAKARPSGHSLLARRLDSGQPSRPRRR